MWIRLLTFFRFLFGLKAPTPKYVDDYDDFDVEDSLIDEAPARPNVFATGTFEHVTLYDLIVALVHGNKSGKVDIQVNGQKAMIVVLEGKLVTALYRDSIGDDAVSRIFLDVAVSKHAEFLIRPADPLDYPPGAQTVRGPTDKLLFQVAMSLDEQRSAVAA